MNQEPNTYSSWCTSDGCGKNLIADLPNQHPPYTDCTMLHRGHSTITLVPSFCRPCTEVMSDGLANVDTLNHHVILPGSCYDVFTLAEGGLTTNKSLGLLADLTGVQLAIGMYGAACICTIFQKL